MHRAAARPADREIRPAVAVQVADREGRWIRADAVGAPRREAAALVHVHRHRAVVIRSDQVWSAVPVQISGWDGGGLSGPNSVGARVLAVASAEQDEYAALPVHVVLEAEQQVPPAVPVHIADR